MFPDHRGFTLIEVLVAAVIMFSALAIGSLAYRTAIRSMERVTAHVLIADALPAVMARIKIKVMDRIDQGGGSYNETISYKWRRKEIKSARNVFSSSNEFTGGMEYGHFRIVLSNIHLTITSSQAGREKVAGYDYQELSWLPVQ